ncbi:MAG: transcriptional regulator [Methanobacterium sp.]|uniref:transcriptional regulator n=1 Tax=Methanobacterium sp. TaxID=2164 RepID=UPI003D65A4AF|nr:transcriptional regulator [Methanobacterium sp.]
MQRDHVLREINELLANHSFETSHIYDRSCFDMVARKRLLLLLLKVLINIDGLTGPQAEEIKKVASTFLASPLVVGLKSKHEYLEEDVVYERHGIPVIAPETLKNMITEEIYPEVFADRGGYFVQVDGNVIKDARERENLSLKDLANKAHVSRETIYKYEHGRVRACPETVITLESILNMKITLSIDIFKIPQSGNVKMAEDTPKELAQLGFGVIKTNKTPFDAIAKSDPELAELKKNIAMITNMEKNRNQKILNKMALNVKDLSGVTGTEAVFIFEHKKNMECIEGVPVVHNWEIKEMESSKEFLKVIKERKECN